VDFLGSLFTRPLIGLDIGVSGIKAVELSGGKNPRLLAYNRIPLPPGIVTPSGELKEPDKLSEGLSRLFSTGFSSKTVAVGAFGNGIITKKVNVPRMSEADLSEQFYWEAEQYIPYSLEEVNLDFALLGDPESNSSGTMEVVMVAAKKDYVNSMKAVLEKAGLKVDVIDSQAFALGNVFEFSYGNMGTGICALIDFGAGTTKLTLVERDKTTFTRDLRQSGSQITQSIAEALGVSFDEAESIKLNDPENAQITTVMRQFIYQTVEEVSRTLDFAVSQASGSNLLGVYVCGGGSRLPGLMEMLEEKLPVPVQPLNPIQNISGSGRKMSGAMIRELSYLGAVSVGLALRKKGE
jgi:type IV pilus assembly protein PilM